MCQICLKKLYLKARIDINLNDACNVLAFEDISELSGYLGGIVKGPILRNKFRKGIRVSLFNPRLKM